MAWISFALVFLMVASSLGTHISDDCHDRLHLGLVFDVSSSYGEGVVLQKVLLFIKVFLGNYDIGLNASRVGVMTYAEEANKLFTFSDQEYQSLDMAKAKIDEALQNTELEGRSLTEKALMLAHDQLFPRPPGHTKPRTLVVFTGGKTPNPQLYPAIVTTLTNRGINIVAVSWDENEASLIAGNRGHAIYTKDVYEALEKLPDIVEATCVMNGGYTEWEEWNACSVTCGGGSQTRIRSCTNPEPSEHGRNCDGLGPAADTRDCNTLTCGDVDGGYTDWSEWSVCSHTCGGGVRTRERLCVNPPQQNNGADCDVIGPAVETDTCNTANCRNGNGDPCSEGLDLAYVMDQSNSIGRRNQEALIKEFLPELSRQFEISRRKTHVGATRFAKTSHFEFNFADSRFWSIESLVEALMNADTSNFHGTRIDRGLETASQELFTTRAGDRSKKQNVMVFFTDGRPYPRNSNKPLSETIPPLTEGKKVHVIAVGFGRRSKITRPFLEEMAGDNVVVMGSRSNYTSYVETVRKMICEVDGGYSQWSMWSLCSVSCGTGVQSRSRSCTAPPFRKGGQDCQGDYFEAQRCDEMDCPQLPAECEGLKLDLALVVEISSQLGLPHFFYAIDFVDKLFHLFDVSPDDTRVSLVLYSKVATRPIAFKDAHYQDKEALDSFLRYIPPHLFSGKHLDRALELVNSSVFTAEAGDRPDAKNAAIFITDGHCHLVNGQNEEMTEAINALKDKNVNMVTVSVGTDIKEQVLYEIAGGNMVLTTSYQDFLSSVEEVAEVTCKAASAE